LRAEVVPWPQNVVRGQNLAKIPGQTGWKEQIREQFVMIRILMLCLAAHLVAVMPAGAEEKRQTLGFGRLFSNDALGDGRDRWRTGAYTVSLLRGPKWDGDLPDRPLEIIEFQARADILAPASLSRPAPGDRPYAGNLSFTGHTHWRQRETDVTVGAGVTLTGPMTGVSELQRLIHEFMGIAPPTGALNSQIGNRVSPRITAEAARRIPLAPGATLRPFLQAETGAETLARVGGEILVGAIWSDSLLLRDMATGQLYTGVRGESTGLGLVLGADIARVADSIWLPSSRGLTLTEYRSRARAGLRWQGQKTSIFYGVTYLGPEFVGQTQGQFVGSMTFDIRF